MSLARYSDVCDILEKIFEDSETDDIAKNKTWDSNKF